MKKETFSHRTAGILKVQFLHIKELKNQCLRDEISVYAAQASFFLVLSSVPFLLLLLSFIRQVPQITPEDLLLALSQFTPEKVHPLLETVISDLYVSSSAAILSLSSFTALWSASRGVLGIERGLNRIVGCNESRTYLLSRLLHSAYTLLLLPICLFSLFLLVLGTRLQRLFLRRLPATDTSLIRSLLHIFNFRFLIAMGILILFFAVLYSRLPCRKTALRQQLPGAVFAAGGWIGCSAAFSIYFRISRGFSHLYGHLTSAALLMLWLYLSLWILFAGAEYNQSICLHKKNRSSP